MFSEVYGATLLRFRRYLRIYTHIIAPLIRSLWALEALRANVSDVWVFFMACAAHLRELFDKAPGETGISRELANKVIDLFNDRYDEFFIDKEIYFSAFIMDPRTCCIVILSCCSAF